MHKTRPCRHGGFFAQSLATILFRVPEHCECVSGRWLTVVAVNSRNACSRSCFEFLFWTRDFRPLPTRAVHFVGSLRCLVDAVSPDSSLAAYRLSCLGDPYGTAPLPLSFHVTRELSPSKSRTPTV